MTAADARAALPARIVFWIENEDGWRYDVLQFSEPDGTYFRALVTDPRGRLLHKTLPYRDTTAAGDAAIRIIQTERARGRQLVPWYRRVQAWWLALWTPGGAS